MKQRIYIDTSVFGGYYDEEFSEHTIPLFNRLRNGDFTLLFSTVTQDELENAPVKVKDLVKSIKIEDTEFIETTNEAVDLAQEYIHNGKSCRANKSRGLFTYCVSYN